MARRPRVDEGSFVDRSICRYEQALKDRETHRVSQQPEGGCRRGRPAHRGGGKSLRSGVFSNRCISTAGSYPIASGVSMEEAGKDSAR